MFSVNGYTDARDLFPLSKPKMQVIFIVSSDLHYITFVSSKTF